MPSPITDPCTSRNSPRPCRGAALLRPSLPGRPKSTPVRFCLCCSRSLPFLRRHEKSRYNGRELLPILGRLLQPLRSAGGDRIKLRFPIVVADAPLRLDQPALMETNQRRVDCPLIEQDSLTADLL